MITAYLIPGVRLDGFWPAFFTAVFLGLVNAVIKPILIILTLPINILTLGLFTILINTAMLMLTSNIGQSFGIGFTVDGFWQALLGSLVISFVSVVMGFILRDELKGRKK